MMDTIDILNRHWNAAANCNIVESSLCVISYNMHGYNQGLSLLHDMISSHTPDLLFLQEHWLTPHNMIKFNNDFTDFYVFGCSAMEACVESGPLVGRPFGGTAILVKKDLLPVCECIDVSDRLVVIKIGDLLCVNVYLPCRGTPDRDLLCKDILDNICHWRSEFVNCGCIIGGDFNIDLDSVGISRSAVAIVVNSFLKDNNMTRCDQVFPSSLCHTYANDVLNVSSKLDYFVFNGINVTDFDIMDLDNNFSDHLPILVKCHVHTTTPLMLDAKCSDSRHVVRLRWDHGDLLAYYNITGQQLEEIFYQLLDIEKGGFTCSDIYLIDSVYDRIVSVLKYAASITIPSRAQNFFKFWWCQELDCLKQQSMESNQLWKAAGRPRFGPIYDRRNKARREYRLGIRKRQSSPTEFYSNDLHEALINKQGKTFWKCWNSKFESNPNKAQLIDGVSDSQEIADKFAIHFSEVCSGHHNDSAKSLAATYASMRANYVGSPHLGELDFDTELIDTVLSSMKRGKAADFLGLTAEHLQYSHPILFCILAKFFNWFMRVGLVPTQFGVSYTVPLLKGNKGYNKKLSVQDFRGISISPVLSKVLEHCILRRFNGFLTTSDNQFGFKKSLSCSQAIYCVRNIVNHYVSNGSTVNLCALDITKAFDRMNHHGLFIKLMSRYIPVSLLNVLEYWFSICSTCIIWNNVHSCMFKLVSGVRQGGVLSPYLFAVYIDDVIQHVKSLNVGCMFRFVNASIILYADDILLLAPSICCLENLLLACETKLHELDLAINVKKSVCIRIGPRCRSPCVPLVMSDGSELCWVESVRYLGVFITRSCHFCSFDNAKKSFYRSFNAIFGKIGRIASADVVMHLIKSKCIPILLYAVEACPVNRSLEKSLQFSVTRILMKIFKTISSDFVMECHNYFCFYTISTLLEK